MTPPTHISVSAPHLLLTQLQHRLERKKLNLPLMFIQATQDHALPPAMSAGMEEFCPNMTRKSVDTSHWALWQAPSEVNGMIKDFLSGVETSKSRL